MKLLFDANLSPRLVPRLNDLFPGSTHVFDVGMVARTPDEAIWRYAPENKFVIVTADRDFLALLEREGAPPKIVRLDKCNYKTRVVEALIRRNAVRINELQHSKRDYLIIRNTS